MATYYLSTSTGNDSWTGLSATFTGGSTGPWKTLAKALGAAGMASGDTLYVAPGNYNETVTIGFAPSAATQIIGDPNSQLFAGINSGPILISAFNAAGTSETITASLIIAASRNYFEWSNIYFKVSTGRAVSATNARYWKFTNCVFDCNTRASPVGVVNLSSATSTALDATITRCRFAGGRYLLVLTGQNVSDTTSVTSCVFESSEEGIDVNNLGLSITNCTFVSCDWAIYQRSGNLSFPTSLRNSLFLRCTQVQVTTTGHLTENFNRWTTATRNNIGTLGANSTTGGDGGIDSGYLLQTNGNYLQTYTPNLSSPNINFGTSTSAPASDLYGVTWTGTSPDAGAITYRVITSLPSLVAYNGGNERNASTITIAPGSTSQSIELYLGATGLTASTSGLSARYNKNRTADVAITLVARTISQPWVAGGFAEVNATTMPGVYRLDIPNESISTGYVNTTIVVRGASGTNGAVVTIQEPQAVGTQLRMGPFTVQADGILTDERLKLIQGSVHSIDFKMVDAYGTGVDGTGTVVTAKVYNAAGFLVDTYTCTPMYALDGRYSFAIDSTVTNNVGMYTINISRQIGSEINVFGRMKLEVLSP